MSILSDKLETDYGTEILEELTGESLTHKGQPVRLFDQSNHSSERYYPEGDNGKPRIYNHQEGKPYFPITAYCQAREVDWNTAVAELSIRYLGGSQTGSKRTGNGRRITPRVAAPAPPINYHDAALVESTLSHYERNDLAIYLRRLLGVKKADEMLTQFRVGTGDNWHVSPWWPRSTVFWQIDQQGRIRAGKVFNYSSATGKRLKGKNPQEHRPYWIHEILTLQDFHPVQCLFGLHQLAEQPTSKPVAIVEGEKTAVICSAFLPGFIWLATGGKGNLTADRCKVLAGRSVTLFPDLGRPKSGELSAFEQWSKKADELRKVVGSVTVSRTLEDEPTVTVLERDAGLDIADMLTRYRCPDTGLVLNEPDGYPALWDA